MVMPVDQRYLLGAGPHAPMPSAPAGTVQAGGPAPTPAAPAEPILNDGRTDAPTPKEQDTSVLSADAIGDIPPPPVPLPPTPATPATLGSGVAGIRGTEAGTFAQPGTRGARVFRSNAFAQQHPPRFGPGVPDLGGGSAAVAGLPSPDDAADILRRLAAGGGVQ